MCPAMDNPTSCRICTPIQFLDPKNMSAAQVHCKLCMAVFGQNVMNERTARWWCRLCKALIKWSVKNGASWFQNFYVKFHKCHIILYEIIRVRLGYHTFYNGWVQKMLTGAHKMQRMVSALTFFKVIPHRWQWISQLHCTRYRWWNGGFL
jgi:hypothetical protein